jgi:hypothetical protein
MIDTHRTRLAVEPVLRDVSRRKGIRPPHVTDAELAELGERPDKMTVFRFVHKKVMSA